MMTGREFVIDYIKRHAHPVNAILHVLGVPAAFIGIYFLFVGRVLSGLVLIVFGYFFAIFRT